jgi:hypothetical protein
MSERWVEGVSQRDEDLYPDATSLFSRTDDAENMTWLLLALLQQRFLSRADHDSILVDGNGKAVSFLTRTHKPRVAVLWSSMR